MKHNAAEFEKSLFVLVRRSSSSVLLGGIGDSQDECLGEQFGSRVRGA